MKTSTRKNVSAKEELNHPQKEYYISMIMNLLMKCNDLDLLDLLLTLLHKSTSP